MEPIFFFLEKKKNEKIIKKLTATLLNFGKFYRKTK